MEGFRLLTQSSAPIVGQISWLLGQLDERNLQCVSRCIRY